MKGSGWKPSRLTLTRPCDAPSSLSMPSGDAYCKPSWPAVWPWFCIAIIVVASESRTEQLMVNMRVGVNVSARQQARHGRRQGAMNAVGMGWPVGRARKSSFAPAAKNGSEGKPGSSRGGIIGCGAGSSAGAMPSTGGASTGVSAILMCGGGEADARGREDALQEDAPACRRGEETT